MKLRLTPPCETEVRLSSGADGAPLFKPGPSYPYVVRKPEPAMSTEEPHEAGVKFDVPCCTCPVISQT